LVRGTSWQKKTPAGLLAARVLFDVGWNEACDLGVGHAAFDGIPQENKPVFSHGTSYSA
jgi:hypothetical protein